LTRPLDRPWLDRDRRLAALASTHMQLMIDNMALFEDVRQRATRDHLTGLWNRWQFWDDLTRSDTQHQMAMLMVDLDYLKRVNDTGGHAAGDIALKRVAQALQEAVGHRGQVYRVGGDEFAVILSQSDASQCLDVYEDAATALAPALSISGGVAVATGDVAADAVMREADAALYMAKEAGRGQVKWVPRAG
jgi:diguanylate cyclase (GGDEF)-like protein